jgi:hypothetical protein
VIDASDLALLAAIWRALEEGGGDETEAAWAVWNRMKTEPGLLNAFLRHVPQFDEASDLFRIAQESLADAGGGDANAGRAFRERTEPRENPDAADDFGCHVVEAFRSIMDPATEAWRRERGERGQR